MPETRAIELQDKVPYRHWSEKGFITLTDGDAVDFDFIYRDLLALIRILPNREVLFRRHVPGRMADSEAGIEHRSRKDRISSDRFTFQPCHENR